MKRFRRGTSVMLLVAASFGAALTSAQHSSPLARDRFPR
jgi:hypothetical protein